MSKTFIVLVIFTVVFIECCVGGKRKQAHPRSSFSNGLPDAQGGENAEKASGDTPKKGEGEEDPLVVHTGKSKWKPAKSNVTDGK
uniref:Uncharacterized protein n=1 Tax=Meloidogyne enterolobii TaxID=390850 RepID=A0A6V7U856_MELEN|nr:unnamed protein product [Meloidogyne enterolobii]